MQEIGFNESKRKLLECLKSKTFYSDPRKDIEVKNLLFTGDMTAEELTKVIKSSNGKHHKSFVHNSMKNVIVHELIHRNIYIKYYFLGNCCYFISVHYENT